MPVILLLPPHYCKIGEEFSNYHKRQRIRDDMENSIQRYLIRLIEVPAPMLQQSIHCDSLVWGISLNLSMRLGMRKWTGAFWLFSHYSMTVHELLANLCYLELTYFDLSRLYCFPINELKPWMRPPSALPSLLFTSKFNNPLYNNSLAGDDLIG
ncbi:hypothetical protein BC833DRAFT_242190 [Globomyces pollinis-pini]|nr:hypothetical protein BC833DRAFT_242190 [Globomyces pollinis-pini]